MKDKQEWFFYIAIIFHFGLMLIFNLNYCLKSQNDLYHREKSYYPKMDKWVNAIKKQTSCFRVYQAFTGSNTAYGFYAPQVSGHLEPYFDLYSDDEKVASYYNINFFTQEADLRYHNAFSQHLQKLDKLFEGEKLSEINDNKYFRFLDLRMQSLCTHVLNRTNSANRIKANLYLYAFPTMHDYTDGKVEFKPTFLKTFEYEYSTQ